MSLDVSILGPITATFDGHPVRLGDKRPRTFFGILAHELRVVENARLIRYLWGDEEDALPTDPSDALQTCAKDVRNALAALPDGRRLLRTTRNLGYQLMINPQQVDKHRFTDLRVRAQAAERSKPSDAFWLGRRALREWKNATGLFGGTPLEDSEGRLQSLIRPLREAHRAVTLLCLRTGLVCGQHEQLLPEMAQLSGEESGAEDSQLTRLHMTALHRAGRTHDAMARFDEYKAALMRNKNDHPSDDMELFAMEVGAGGGKSIDPPEEGYAPFAEEDATETAEEESAPAAPRADMQPLPEAQFNSFQYGDNSSTFQATTMNFDQRRNQ